MICNFDFCPRRRVDGERYCEEHVPARQPRARRGVYAGREGSTRRWRLLRARVLRRDGNRCTVVVHGERCPQTTRLEVDHVVARRHGGKDTLANLRTMCHGHHVAKTTDDGRREGPLHPGLGPLNRLPDSAALPIDFRSYGSGTSLRRAEGSR